MSALAVVRWLTLNDPDVATLVLDLRISAAVARLGAEASSNAAAFAASLEAVNATLGTTSAEAQAMAERVRRMGNGEPANRTRGTDRTRETAGQDTTLPEVRAEVAGVVLQHVADSPHDPTGGGSDETPAGKARRGSGRLDVIPELIEALKAGRLRIVDRKPYFVNGRQLVDYTLEWVDP